MNPIIKKTIANALLVAIALCFGFGTYHLGANSDVATIVAMVAVAVAKLDEMRIHRIRSRATA